MHVHSESASSWLLNLANGVTTVREMGGLPWLLASREAIAADRIAGPNLYVAGTIINYVPLGGYAAVVKDAVTARRVVRQQVACGYDFIKIHNVLPGPLLDAVADEAARQGIDLVGHVPHGVPVRHAVERGMRTLEHFKGFLDDRTLEIGDTDYAAANNAELWVTPTLYAFRYFERDDVPSLLRSPPARYVPQRTRRSWVSGLPKQGSASDTLAESLPGRMRQIVQSLLAHDAQFLAGTDAANYPFQVMGFALLDEMRLLAEAGVPWSEVLRSATSSPAAAMRTKQFGRLRPGTRADIVLLDRNPLADRTAYQRNQGVMVGGRWLDRALLDRALAQLADLFEQPPLSDQPDRQQMTALVGKVAEKTAEGFVFNSRTVLAAADQVRRSGDAAAADRLV